LLREGTRWWRSSVNHQPSPEAQRWYETGTSAMRDGAYYQASKLLGNAIKADGKFVLAHVRLADAWTELDYTDKAKDELILASSLVPDRSNLESTEALYLQAMTATLSHDFKSAVESYERIAQTSPEPENLTPTLI
jgi:tetratricopeptide (TPR) repeat protein